MAGGAHLYLLPPKWSTLALMTQVSLPYLHPIVRWQSWHWCDAATDVQVKWSRYTDEGRSGGQALITDGYWVIWRGTHQFHQITNQLSDMRPTQCLLLWDRRAVVGLVAKGKGACMMRCLL